MNLLVIYQSADGITHLITPPLNGQILPGVTRDSLLTLARLHIAGEFTVDGLPTEKFVVEEVEFGTDDLKRWADAGELKEAFGAGTAASKLHTSTLRERDVNRR